MKTLEFNFVKMIQPDRILYQGLTYYFTFTFQKAEYNINYKILESFFKFIIHVYWAELHVQQTYLFLRTETFVRDFELNDSPPIQDRRKPWSIWEGGSIGPHILALLKPNYFKKQHSSSSFLLT